MGKKPKHQHAKSEQPEKYAPHRIEDSKDKAALVLEIEARFSRSLGTLLDTVSPGNGSRLADEFITSLDGYIEMTVERIAEEVVNEALDDLTPFGENDNGAGADGNAQG